MGKAWARWMGATALLALTLAVGCQSTRVGQPLAAEAVGSDPESQLRYWHDMADLPVTTNDQAFHGLLLFLDGQDAATDYAGRVKLLQDRRLLPADFDGQAIGPVRRGTLAGAVIRVLEIKGGLSLHVVGPHALGGRYAVRELEYRGIFPASSPNQTFSGLEFLGIIGKVEDAQRRARMVAAADEKQAAAPVETAGPDAGAK